MIKHDLKIDALQNKCLRKTPFVFQTWELMILNVLGWDLSAVTPYSILDQLLRSLELDNSAETALSMEKVRKHAETLVALAATEYAFCQKSPALVAVASLGAALRGLNTQGLDKMISSLEITTGVKKVRRR